MFMRALHAVLIFALLTFQAHAAQPQRWQLNFQKAASPVMESVYNFHNALLVLIFGIVLFVFALLAYVCIRFKRSNNPVPSTRTHNVLLEIIWTAIPTIILVVVVFPSMRVLKQMQENVTPDVIIKVIGHQWYWEYKYPQYKDFGFDSYMIKDADLKAGQLRLLEVDNRLIVPVNSTVKVLVTSYDVIHSWAVPSLGVKMDAVPGRLNETWFKVTAPGVYYGQCSEICGIGHAFMPIAVEAVDQETFDKWIKTKTV